MKGQRYSRQGRKIGFTVEVLTEGSERRGRKDTDYKDYETGPSQK